MKLLTTVCTIFLLLYLSSCTTKNLGTIRESHEVTNIFRSSAINEAYNYYYYGIADLPDAIIGIDKRYTVQSRLWQYIELTEDSLSKLIMDLDRFSPAGDFTPRYMNRYQGSFILDPGKRRIGIWYSKYDWGVFEFPEPRVIIPYAPALSPGSQLISIRRFHD